MKVVYYTWWFSPVYGDSLGCPEHIEARCLDHAFVKARLLWPGADGWHCGGRVNARFPGLATRVDNGIRETVTRARWP
jgi:hypothetical protein